MDQRADVEISWFSALCDDDYRFLGVEDPSLKASWPHCRDIALAAEANGYDNYCCHQVIRWAWTRLRLPAALRHFWKNAPARGCALWRNVGTPACAPTGNA